MAELEEADSCDACLAREAVAQHLRGLLQTVSDALGAAKVGTWHWNLRSNHIIWDRRAAHLLGVPEDTPSSYSDILALADPADRPALDSALIRALRGGQPFEAELRLPGRGAAEQTVLLRGQLQRRGSASVWMSGACWDVTEHRRSEQQSRELAYRDALTGLPNRRHFLERLGEAIRDASARERRVGVLFLDLDRFKEINDSLGHLLGDDLLVQVAQRLLSCVRLRDLVGCTPAGGRRSEPAVSRMGGDEFTVLLDDLDGPQIPGRVAERILRAFFTPFTLGGRQVHVSPSIGIALFPDDGEDAATILANADAAMYHAKQEGANDFRFYGSALNEEARRRAEVARRLERALRSGALALEYQPIFGAARLELCAVEACVRIRDAGVALPAAELRSVAEESGLIVPLADWMLERACRQLRDWQRAGHPDLELALDVSVQQLRRSELLAVIDKVLHDTGVPAGTLMLEIPESAVRQEDDALLRTLERLVRTGVQLTLDEFGTARTVLGSLWSAPFSWMKLARPSFDGSRTRAEGRALSIATLQLASAVGMRVVGGGVENEVELDFLRRHGCERVQGGYLGAALPPERIRGLLETVGADPTGTSGSP